MADEEMRTIKDLDTEFLQNNRKKLWAYFAPVDDWVGDWVNDIVHRLDTDKIIYGPVHITHAFCIGMRL